MALDPELFSYNELLEDTVGGREQEQDTLSEAFSFTDYKVCSHLINAQENQTMDWESCLEIEAKIADFQSIFASVAMSDLQEDEGFEKLLKLYTSVLSEFSFEPDSATMESKLLKGLKRRRGGSTLDTCTRKHNKKSNCWVSKDVPLLQSFAKGRLNFTHIT